MSEELDVVADFEDEIKRLRASNAELVEALNIANAALKNHPTGDTRWPEDVEKADAAIAAARRTI
jgi:hypothetical protein